MSKKKLQISFYIRKSSANVMSSFKPCTRHSHNVHNKKSCSTGYIFQDNSVLLGNIFNICLKSFFVRKSIDLVADTVEFVIIIVILDNMCGIKSNPHNWHIRGMRTATTHSYVCCQYSGSPIHNYSRVFTAKRSFSCKSYAFAPLKSRHLKYRRLSTTFLPTFSAPWVHHYLHYVP